MRDVLSVDTDITFVISYSCKMCNIFQIQLGLGFLIATFGLVAPCLITNCPNGGKRSEVGSDVQCTPCGPANEGVCVDRGICCSRGIGCHTSPKQCRNASSSQSSCLWELIEPACGDGGRCKSKYLCCFKDQCMLNMTCKSMPSAKYKELAGPFSTIQLLPSFPLTAFSNQIGMIEDDDGKKYDWSTLTSDYNS